MITQSDLSAEAYHNGQQAYWAGQPYPTEHPIESGALPTSHDFKRGWLAAAHQAAMALLAGGDAIKHRGKLHAAMTQAYAALNRCKAIPRLGPGDRRQIEEALIQIGATLPYVAPPKPGPS